MNENKKIIYEKLKYFLISVITIIILYIIYFIYSEIILSVSDKILILFVFGAFTTELIFYFSIVRKYEFIGDMEIVNILYKNISVKYNFLNTINKQA